MPHISESREEAVAIPNVHAGEATGKGKRKKFPSTKLHDYVTNTVRLVSPSPPASSSTPIKSSGMSYPITHFVNCERFSVGHKNFLAVVSVGVEPRSVKEAMKDPKWRDAMQKEISALEDNETWSLVSLPPGKKALGSLWVYKIKYNSDGNIERFKVRLVVFGNHQVEGIDYTDTFAPVAKMTIVRAFLAVAAAKN